ncbi:hypothetical protein [Streptomyces sp. NPDC002156]
MPTRTPRRRPSLKSGIGFGISTGTASVNSAWKVQIINANIPSGTGSVKLEIPASGASACAKLNTSSKTTDTGTVIHADVTWNLSTGSRQMTTSARTT